MVSASLISLISLIPYLLARLNHRAGEGESSICDTSRVIKRGAGHPQRQQDAEKASCVTGLMRWFSSIQSRDTSEKEDSLMSKTFGK